MTSFSNKIRNCYICVYYNDNYYKTIKPTMKLIKHILCKPILLGNCSNTNNFV